MGVQVSKYEFWHQIFQTHTPSCVSGLAKCAGVFKKRSPRWAAGKPHTFVKNTHRRRVQKTT